ncbi:sensor histidine kinase [Ferrovibrio xuzhouensis]|uniref:histidine kinase n=1 Tax=Ferrovibrio xuzhouensis TaxID=1576914 RepID=A0ABV7VAQ9_9PROT
MIIPRHFRTLGFRLSMLYAGLFVVSTGLLFGIVYWIAAQVLQQQNVTILQNEVAALTEGVAPPSANGVATEIDRRLQEGKYRPLYYRLETSAGNKLSGNLPALRLQPGWHKFSYPVGQLTSYPPEDEDEHTIRLLGLTSRLPSGDLLSVAVDTYRSREAKEAIIRAFSWAAAAGLILALIGGLLLSRGFLRRIDAINRATQAIMDGNLSRRIEVIGGGDELDRLSSNLNEMLDRLQALMEGLRQVSNDIAHDLRTPLSRLKQRLEDVQAADTTREGYRIATGLALQDASEALTTFSALLRIAQIEAGTRRSQFTEIDLCELLTDLAATYGPVAEDLGKTISTELTPAVRIQGDRELLTQMFVNIIENALRHTNQSASVSLVLRMLDGVPTAEVVDDGPGIPPAEREKVFRRFYRLEGSRSTPGNGLGLALVAAVAELHRIRISLEDNQPGLTVRLSFPIDF